MADLPCHWSTRGPGSEWGPWPPVCWQRTSTSAARRGLYGAYRGVATPLYAPYNPRLAADVLVRCQHTGGHGPHSDPGPRVDQWHGRSAIHYWLFYTDRSGERGRSRTGSGDLRGAERYQRFPRDAHHFATHICGPRGSWCHHLHTWRGTRMVTAS